MDKPAKEAKNCWEHMCCTPEQRGSCIVFREKMGDCCWFVCDIKEGKSCSWEVCLKCDWYIKNNP